MSNSCSALATKAEVAALEKKYISKTQEAAIYGNAASISQQLITASAAVQGAKIANALEKANAAKAAAAAAKTATQKATQEALIAKGKAILAQQTAGQASNAAFHAGSQAGLAKAAAAASQKAAASATHQALISKGTAIAAQQAAKKAGFDALYASSKASAAAANAAKAGGLASKALGLVGGVFAIIGTLATAAALAILAAKVNNLTKRLDSFEKNTIQNLTNLKHKDAQLKSEIAKNAKAIEFANSKIAAIESALKLANNKLAAQASQISANESQIAQVKQDVAATNQQIIAVKNEVATVTAKVKTTNSKVATVTAEVEQVKQKQATLEAKFKALEQKQLVSDALATQRHIETLQKTSVIPIVKKKVDYLGGKVTDYDLDMQTLKSGLEVSNKLTNDKITQLNQQTNNTNLKFQDLTNKLPQTITETITKNPDLSVNTEQYNKLDAKVTTLNSKLDLINPYTISVAVGALPILQQILNKNPTVTPCQAPILVPPVHQQTIANNAATATLQTVTIAQNQATQNILNNSVFGLQAIRNFLNIAWQSTRVGKIFNYLSVAISLHNAAMLSRNLAGSLGDTISAIANNTISLIKNEESNAIDINETIGTSLENFLSGILGVETYQGLSENFAKYNRILSAASNIIYSIQSIQMGLAEGLEIIGSYTGKIGNALKRSGAILENSYSWMSETFSVKTGRLGAIDKVVKGLETVENVGSELQNATEEFREVQESVSNINSQATKIRTELNIQETEKNEAEGDNKSNSQGAQPEASDYTPDPQ